MCQFMVQPALRISCPHVPAVDGTLHTGTGRSTVAHAVTVALAIETGCMQRSGTTAQPVCIAMQSYNCSMMHQALLPFTHSQGLRRPRRLLSDGGVCKAQHSEFQDN